MISTITLDTYKQQIGSGDAFNLSDSFNGRVGDEQVPLVVQFKERGLAQQFQDGLVPFLTGFVGSLDENDQVTAETGEAVSYVGTSDDIVGLGRVKMNLPGTMFPQEGYFYGFLGLQNADGKRVSTFNVWFHVYNGNPDMFVNKAPFRTELQKVLDTAQSLINDSNGDLNQWKQKLTDLFSTLSAQGTDTSTLLTTLETKIKEDGLFTNSEADSFQKKITEQLTDSITNMNASLTDFSKNASAYALDRHLLTYKSVSLSVTPNNSVQAPTADFPFNHLANMGTSASIVVMMNVNNATDPNVTMPNDSVITNAISAAKTAGVSITMLKPHIGTSYMDWLDRSTYKPSNWDTFWNNWQTIMLHYAGLCDANNIPILCLGCEQYNCTDISMLSHWATITQTIRAKYPDLKLTYAAVGEEYLDYEGHGAIAQYLDYMGWNIYPSYTYKLVAKNNSTGIAVDELTRAYYNSTVNYHEAVDKYKELYGKLTFITETGVEPTDDGLVKLTSDNNMTQNSDPTQQTGLFETPALAMEAFFNGLAQNPNIVGFAWWAVGYPFYFFNNVETSIAETTMRKYVKGGLL
ncbi:hypothetical protein J8137_02330 [Lactiplantibacillus plantarum]|nr:hypothetical protein [Lactiplantibacillus plantarum]